MIACGKFGVVGNAASIAAENSCTKCSVIGIGESISSKFNNGAAVLPRSFAIA